MCCWNSSWIADRVLERFCKLGGSRLWRTYLTTDMQHLYVCDCTAFILCFVSFSDTLFSFCVSVDLLLWDKLPTFTLTCTSTHFVFVMFLVHFLCFFNLLFLHFLIQHTYRAFILNAQLLQENQTFASFFCLCLLYKLPLCTVHSFCPSVDFSHIMSSDSFHLLPTTKVFRSLPNYCFFSLSFVICIVWEEAKNKNYFEWGLYGNSKVQAG